jgi:hypothetical protein
MTQAMSVDPPEASPSGGLRYNAAHRLGAHGVMGGLDPYKYRSPLSACGTTTLQVGGYRLADV